MTEKKTPEKIVDEAVELEEESLEEVTGGRSLSQTSFKVGDTAFKLGDTSFKLGETAVKIDYSKTSFKV